MCLVNIMSGVNKKMRTIRIATLIVLSLNQGCSEQYAYINEFKSNKRSMTDVLLLSPFYK